MRIPILVRHLYIQMAPKSAVWWWCLCVFGVLIVKCVSCLVCDDINWLSVPIFLISLALPHTHTNTHTYIYIHYLNQRIFGMSSPKSTVTQYARTRISCMLHGQMTTYVIISLPLHGNYFWDVCSALQWQWVNGLGSEVKWLTSDDLTMGVTVTTCPWRMLFHIHCWDLRTSFGWLYRDTD